MTEDYVRGVITVLATVKPNHTFGIEREGLSGSWCIVVRWGTGHLLVLSDADDVVYYSYKNCTCDRAA